MSDRIKVNDARGNPIEIAAAIVWRVRDAAQALFDVQDYEAFLRVQAETAIRHLASSCPYDEGIVDVEDGEYEPRSPKRTAELTLRSSMVQVTGSLMTELAERLDVAGIAIDDAKLTHLAYASEIAGVMLRRQQAEAIIAARQKIVLGAVTMVDMALKGLSDRHIVELDDEPFAGIAARGAEPRRTEQLASGRHRALGRRAAPKRVARAGAGVTTAMMTFDGRLRPVPNPRRARRGTPG